MTKKCIGCGLELQNIYKDDKGYTPNLDYVYCKRCFRLKNYGEKDETEVVDQNMIINKVNKGKGVAFFLIDYLNINKYTLDIFKKIKLDKVLVISKCDTLRKDMKFTKIVKWLDKVYDIKEDVLFISKNNDFKSGNIFKYMDKIRANTGYIMGITNAGKSTFINSILKKNKINKKIVVSNKPNTTLDFIKLYIGDYIIYDTPGFDYLNLNYKIINREIKPITFKINKEVTISVNGFDFYFDRPNNITIYTTDNMVKRYYKNIINKGNNVKVFDNSDIVMPGIGFINIKKACIVKTKLEVEVRPNMSGEDYE